MVRTRYGVWLALVLGGCASVASLETKEPTVAYQSPRPPVDILDCISRAWSDQGGAVNTQIRGDGYVISLQGAWGVDASAVIAADGAGSRVHYAERIASLSPGDWAREVAACR